MRKSVLAVLFMLISSFALLAQDSRTVDVYGGYSYVRTNPGNGASGTNNNGWESTATFNVRPNLALAADINGAYYSNSGAHNHLYTYLFGPELRMNQGKGSPFAHALFGFGHDSVTASAFGGTFSSSSNAFAAALGAGYDWKMSDDISIRPVQFDYLMTRFSSSTQNNIRISVGVVFHPKMFNR